MPSEPAGQASFNCKVWLTPLFKCSSYVENKKVREKKIKKITHLKNFYYFYFFVMLVSSVVWFESFIPFWAFLFSTFFPPSNNFWPVLFDSPIYSRIPKNRKYGLRFDQLTWFSFRLILSDAEYFNMKKNETIFLGVWGNVYVPITRIWPV